MTLPPDLNATVTIDAPTGVVRVWPVPLPPFMSETIANLDLGVRACNCLEGVRVMTVGQLIQCTQDDLLRIHGLGRTTLFEIRRKLAHHGLHLKGEGMPNAHGRWPHEDKQAV